MRARRRELLRINNAARRAQQQLDNDDEKIAVTATLWVPLKDSDGNHAHSLLPRLRGAGARKHHVDPAGAYWQEWSMKNVIVPARSVKGLEQNVIYYDAEYEELQPKLPASADENGGVLTYEPLRTAYNVIGYRHPAVRFTWTPLPKGTGEDTTLDEENHDVTRRTVYSRYRAVPLGTLRKWLSDDEGRDTVRMPRRCVLDLLLELYAEDVTAYQQGGYRGETQRRYVNCDGKPLVEMTQEGLWRFFFLPRRQARCMTQQPISASACVSCDVSLWSSA